MLSLSYLDVYDSVILFQLGAGLDIYEFNLLDLPVNGGLGLTNSQTFENGVFFDSMDHLSGANGIKTFSLRHIISLAVFPKTSLINSG